MLEAYSLNLPVVADSYVAFKNISLDKGCGETLTGESSIQLNRSGVYQVSVDATAAASTTLQLYKNGVAQPQAQSTGLTPSFVSFIQVPNNNSCCPCVSPTTIQVMNTTETTLTNVNITIRKIA